MTDSELHRLLEEIDSGGSTTEVISPSITTPLSTKFQVMFWIFVMLLLVMLLGLRCVEKGNKASRGMAVFGMACGVISTLLMLLMIWGVLPFMESSGFFSYSLTVIGKITICMMITTVAMIVGALVARIRESEKMVKVLKLVAIVCGAIAWVAMMIMAFSSDYQLMYKIAAIGGISLACFNISWIVALMMSRFGISGQKDNAGKQKEGVETKDIRNMPTHSGQGPVNLHDSSIHSEVAVGLSSSQPVQAPTRPESTAVNVSEPQPIHVENGKTPVM